MVLHARKLKFTYVKVSLTAMALYLFLMAEYRTLETTGANYYHVFINDTEIGTVGERWEADELLLRARRDIALQSRELTFIEADMTVVGEEVLWGDLDDEAVLLDRMKEVLQENVIQTMHRSYTLKVNEYTVNLGSVDEVRELLQAAVNKYDTEGKFAVELVHDPSKELTMLTADVKEREAAENGKTDNRDYIAAGVQAVLAQIGDRVYDGREKGFEDYELGLKEVYFAEKVEIVETYLPESRLASLETAIEEVIKEQETPSEYTIVQGDTLSEIAIKVNIPIERIIEMNSDKLENENSTIREGDTLIVTVPEPELSVERMERNYYEEIYDKEIEYIDRDDWFTYQTNVIRQPSAGFRRVVVDVHYLNDHEVSRDILKEEVVQEAVGKVVERGTKIPPTYIRPVSGGRQTSGFGKRPRPTKGASTYHKGVDWAVPTGTSVYASCGGTVAKAGWGSGYGYVVYINHIDGRQTRYAHLSKVLVKAGQTVKQGERIALSGSTGISSGPHLHFEMLIGGSQVNPLKYLK